MDVADLVARAGATTVRPSPATPVLWRLLWVVCLLTLPLPYYVFALEVAPVARMLALGGLTFLVWAAEGDLVPGLIVAFSLVPAMVYAALLYFLLRRGAVLTARRLGSTHAGTLMALLAAACLLLSLLPIYRTPLSNEAATANLFGILR